LPTTSTLSPLDDPILYPFVDGHLRMAREQRGLEPADIHAVRERWGPVGNRRLEHELGFDGASIRGDGRLRFWVDLPPSLRGGVSVRISAQQDTDAARIKVKLRRAGGELRPIRRVVRYMRLA